MTPEDIDKSVHAMTNLRGAIENVLALADEEKWARDALVERLARMMMSAQRECVRNGVLLVQVKLKEALGIR